MAHLRKSVAVVLGAFVIVVVAAAPAWADHEVAWGIDDPNGSLDRTEASAAPVDYEVLVRFGDEPLPGFPMTVQVTPSEGEAQTVDLLTDDLGRASFTIDPAVFPGADSVAVQLCDADGCLYGTSNVALPGASPTSTGSVSTEPPLTTESTVAPTSAPTTSTVGGTQTRDGGGGGTTVPWAPLAGGGLLVLLIGGGLFFSSKERTPTSTCGWGVIVVDDRGDKRVKTPEGTSCGDYRIEITTKVTDPPSIRDKVSSDQVERTVGGLIMDLLDFWDVATTWFTQKRTERTSYEPHGISVANGALSSDIPVDATVLKASGVAVRDGQKKVTLHNRSIEETTVEVVFVPSPESPCKVEGAHEFEVEGRSRVRLRAENTCTHDGGDLSAEIGRFPNNGAAHEAFDKSKDTKVMEALTPTGVCDAALSAAAKATTSISSPQGFTYSVSEPSGGASTKGMPGITKPVISGPSAEAGAGGFKAGSVGVAIEPATGHNDRRAISYHGEGHTTIEGAKFKASFRSDTESEVKHTTHDVASSVWMATKVTASVNVAHQLRLRAITDATKMGCDCDPPRLEVRIGPSLSLDTVDLGEDELMVPGADENGDAEIRFGDNRVWLQRPTSTGVGITHWRFTSEGFVERG